MSDAGERIISTMPADVLFLSRLAASIEEAA